MNDSVIRGLKNLEAMKVNVDGRETMPYFDLANTLMNAIQNSARAETIKLSSSEGIRFGQDFEITPSNINRLQEVYRKNTEQFHEIIYNTVVNQLKDNETALNDILDRELREL